MPPRPPYLDINARLNELMPRWLQFFNIDMDAQSWTLGGMEGFSRGDLRDYTLEFERLRELDPSGLSTYLRMRAVFRQYLEGMKTTAWAIITDPDDVEAKAAPMREFWKLLDVPDVLEEISRFRDIVRDACRHYGMLDLDDDFMSWMDAEGLSVLRRDAISSMDKLKAHQFTQGKGVDTPLLAHPEVLEFWNVPSLLVYLRNQPVSGITLVLLRDPEHALAGSFFAFAIRNGDTITLVHDRPNAPHPDYKRMTRRPDKAFYRRAAANWFPYDLMKLEIDEHGRQLYAKARTDLVPLNAIGAPIGKLSDLPPANLIWVSLMFSLLADRYGRENHQLPDLAYTGEMIRRPFALVGEHGALVRNGQYHVLELDPVTPHTAREKAAYEWKSTGFMDWMVDRYDKDVPAAVYDLVGAHEALQLQVQHFVMPREGPTMRGEDHRTTIRGLDGMMFGTKEVLDKERHWVANRNRAVFIQRLADQEYRAERDKIARWYKEHVTANRDVLLNAVVAGKLIVPRWRPREMAGFYPYRSPGVSDADYEAEVKEWKRRSESYFDEANIVSQEANDEVRLWVPVGVEIGGKYCADRPKVVASVGWYMRPTCPGALAILAGVTVDELPWALKHWYIRKPYGGNPILDRVDPIEDLRNPWIDGLPGERSESFWGGVRVRMSKRAVAARRKALGLKGD